MKRSFLGATFLIGGVRGRMHVAASAKRLLDMVPPDVRTELAAALSAARDRGILAAAA